MSKKLITITNADIKKHINSVVAEQSGSKNSKENMKNKRVVRLTESELKRYIKKIISEQATPPAPAPTGGGPNFNQVTPKVPVVGGTAAEKLKELVGKAVLCQATGRGAYYKCVIRSVGQTKNNVVYLMVSCENDPKVQFIRYMPDEDENDGKELAVGGNGMTTTPVICKGLLDWLKQNIKPYYEQYDFAKKGGSNMNADFS